MLFVGVDAVVAQGLADPLTLQGLDQIQILGARARGMGGASVGNPSDATALFSNPAALRVLSAPEIRISGWTRASTISQRQEWIPDRLYGEFSLLMENRQTYRIAPVDNISANWEQTSSTIRPSLAVGALPVNLGGIDVVLGIGGAELFDLNHYYRNNNGLNPNIGQLRPAPIPRVSGTDSLMVDWFQFVREREGVIYAVTPAISVALTADISLGFSVSVLSGSSDDAESRTGRGLFNLKVNNNYSLAATDYHRAMSGTSTYSGTFTTVGFFYKTETIGIGISARTPFTLTQEQDFGSVFDTAGVRSVSQQSGSVEVKFPWIYTVGIALHPANNLSIGIDYGIRELNLVEAKAADGNTSTPWLASRVFHTGAEYRMTEELVVRLGYRQTANGFGEEGSGLTEEAVGGSAYSLGAGYRFGVIHVDGFYEMAETEFIDRWLSNANFNSRSSHTFGVEVSVTF